jgi:hypothetical protein
LALGYALGSIDLLGATMKLSSCPRCERHVLVEASSCPFCGTRLGTTSALGRAMMIAVVGLSMSCGGDDTSDDTVGATSQSDTTQGTGGTSINNQSDSGGADYAGPGTDEFGETTYGGETSSSGGGESSSSSSGTSGTSGGETDTGDSSSGTPTDSGGADYAGAGPS